MPRSKPDAFPGADQATDHMPVDIATHLAEIFTTDSLPLKSKPDAFPGADHATNMTVDIVAHLDEIFGPTTTSTAQAPDTSNPPESVVSIDLPDHAHEVLSGLPQVPDWLL